MPGHIEVGLSLNGRNMAALLWNGQFTSNELDITCLMCRVVAHNSFRISGGNESIDIIFRVIVVTEGREERKQLDGQAAF